MKHKEKNHGPTKSAQQIIDISLGNVKSLIQGLQQIVNFLKKGSDAEKLYAACHAEFICNAIKDDEDIPKKLYNDLVRKIADGTIEPMPVEESKTKH